MVDDGVRLFDEKTRRHDSQYARRSGGETADDADQLLRVEGLREIRLSVAAIGLAPWIGDSGEDHEWDSTERHAKLARERRSIHPRHLHVENDDGGWIVLNHLKRLRAVAGLDDAETALGEQMALGRVRLDVVVAVQTSVWLRNYTSSQG